MHTPQLNVLTVYVYIYVLKHLIASSEAYFFFKCLKDACVSIIYQKWMKRTVSGGEWNVWMKCPTWKNSLQI